MAGLGDGAIAAIVIGAVIGALTAAIAIGVIFWLCMRGSAAGKAAIPSVAPGVATGDNQLIPLDYNGNAFGASGNFGGFPNNITYDNVLGVCLLQTFSMCH